MVLSTSPDARVALIVGITGNQGGSVARSLLTSSKPYKIIGITRDASSPAAKAWSDRGVELRQVNIGVGNEAAALKAFQGGEIIFAVTNPNEHGDTAREIAEGKLMVDAAIAARASLFIWSSASNISTLSSSKYVHCAAFDSKALVADYLSTTSLPHALVPCGSFSTNFIAPGWFAPILQPDGTYLLRLPISPSREIPLLNPSEDYGDYVRAAIEVEGLGPGSEVLTGCETTPEELVEGLAEASGKTVRYEQVDWQPYFASLGGEHNPRAAFLADMFSFFGEFGYYGPKDVAASQAAAKVTPRTWPEILAAHKGPFFKE